MSCENCLLKDRVSALEKDSERNSSQHRDFYASFSNIDKKQAVSDEKYSQILTTQKSMDDKLTKMLDEPRQNYNAIKMCVATCVITALISGSIGYLVSFIK